MSKPEKQIRYDSVITVEGTGQFPFDMLRYDACFPFSEEDSHLMADDDPVKPRAVRLRRLSANPDGPTLKRWESFTWKVTNVDTDNI